MVGGVISFVAYFIFAMPIGIPLMFLTPARAAGIYTSISTCVLPGEKKQQPNYPFIETRSTIFVLRRFYSYDVLTVTYAAKLDVLHQENCRNVVC